MPDWDAEGTMARAEREAIIAALVHCGQCRSAAAARLRVSRSTLYRLMVAYEIRSCRPVAATGAMLPQPFGKSKLAYRGRTRESCGTKSVQPYAPMPASKVVFDKGVWLLVPA